MAVVKALFKKLAGSPQRPNSFLESQSDSDLPVKKDPLTPTQVRRIMHASLVSQPLSVCQYYETAPDSLCHN